MEAPSITPLIQEQFSLLQTEYIRLLNNKDVLQDWSRPQLEALFTVKIGKYQLERLQLQLSIKGLKRKIELVYAAINQDKPVDFATIELNVASELAHTELQIMGKAEEILQAQYMLSHLGSPERSTELRQLFKQLAKQLHPDVNPELTSEQIEIWHKVRDAYEVGDLERLKALQVIYEKEISQASDLIQNLSEDELQLRIEALSEGYQ